MLAKAVRVLTFLAVSSSLGAVACMAPGESELAGGSSKKESDSTSKKKKKTTEDDELPSPKGDVSAPADPSTPSTPIGPGGGDPTANAPMLSLLTPASATQGATTLTLTVAGSNFASNATVKFGGQAVPAQLSGANSLTATLSAANLATVGNFPVVVSSAGVDSNPINFQVVARNLAVRVSNLQPSSVLEDSQATTLNVTGVDFGALARVTFNGTEIPTTYNSATSLTATIPAASLSRPGSFPVAVVSNGQTSAPVTFTVNARPVPTLTSTDITGVFQGRGDSPLTVRGSNYDSSTRVAVYSPARPNGVALTPSTVSATQAVVTVPALDFSQAGTITVRVYNLLPVGTGLYASNSLAITVTASGGETPSAPTLTSSTPSAWIANSSGTVTLSGTGFTPQSIVEFDGGDCTLVNTECRTNAPATTGATTITFFYTGTTPAGNIAIRVKNGAQVSNAIVIRLANQ